MNINILFVGVGGQGTILASKILTAALTNAGYDVKMSEVHGMSQRGGSVTTQIRFGDKVYAPLIDKGKADYILAFEKMEGLRWIEFLAPEGLMIVNDLEVPPVPVLMGLKEYPGDVLDQIKSRAKNVEVVNAFKLGEEAGNFRSQNVALLGALAKYIKADNWEKAIEESVPPQTLDINIKAFRLGSGK